MFISVKHWIRQYDNKTTLYNTKVQTLKQLLTFYKSLDVSVFCFVWLPWSEMSYSYSQEVAQAEIFCSHMVTAISNAAIIQH